MLACPGLIRPQRSFAPIGRASRGLRSQPITVIVCVPDTNPDGLDYSSWNDLDTSFGVARIADSPPDRYTSRDDFGQPCNSRCCRGCGSPPAPDNSQPWPLARDPDYDRDQPLPCCRALSRLNRARPRKLSKLYVSSSSPAPAGVVRLIAATTGVLACIADYNGFIFYVDQDRLGPSAYQDSGG